ncbi:MAG: histone deacetylase family protein [Spirochaetes bacterium]|nr:histone deacetylase family protein [Spirochaetota bacterium]
MGFSIRKIYDDFLPANQRAIEQIINITRQQIPDMKEEYFDVMRGFFRNPIYRKMRHIFFVVDDSRGDVKGFAQLSYAPDLKFCFLDLMAMRRGNVGGGMGSALYERVREEAKYLNARGIYIECLTDDGRVFKDKKMLRQNRARLRFYEQYGVRPIANTNYESHSRLHYNYPYFLLYDDLDTNKLPSNEEFKKIVTAILKRKYEPPCSKRDINMLLRSIKDDPIVLRQPRYIKSEADRQIKKIPDDMKIVLICNEGHEIHHIRERGYVESPVRIKTILAELDKTNLFFKMMPKRFSEKWIREVHSADFVNYFKKVTMAMSKEQTLYPDVFPIRKAVSPPKKLFSRAGYYCIDVYSPINRNSYLAARGAVNCALTAADEILEGTRIAYALVRPPGHHADTDSFGGFCYFNSTAIAANYLSRYGKVAVLDIDYHHGNGQQEIFYQRQSVLTVSIHADPNFEYPHFFGFKNEIGKGFGEGFNINYPLPQGIGGVVYLKTLKKAIRNIRAFAPDFLVLALGFDTAKGDPTGTWKLQKNDFRAVGKLIGALKIPILVVQEGGYNIRNLGINARYFFTGLWEGMYL